MKLEDVKKDIDNFFDSISAEELYNVSVNKYNFTEQSKDSMNRADAKEIARTITNEQLEQMLDNAKNNITDWSKVSIVNKTFSKGTAWNILAKDFNVNCMYPILTKTTIIREFGEYLPEDLKIKNISKPKPKVRVIHQEPIFKDKK